MFTIALGTPCKLITLMPNKDPVISDWVTRKDLAFSESLIDPIVVKTMVSTAKKPLAVRIAKEGYALFGGESGGDRQAIYVLAIPYSAILIN